MSELFSGKGALGSGVSTSTVIFCALGILLIAAIISYNMSKNRY